jgi:acylpyruvate hydrolase
MKIICVGRNYALHAKELGNEIPTEPVLFLKPETALVPPRNPLFIPWFSQNLHFETEIVLRIGKNGKHIEPQFAHRYIDKIGLGLDMTARDVQDACKAKGLPWEKAKAFDGSAVVGKLLPAETFPDWKNINFYLTKNEETVQSGTTGDMLFSFEELVSHISKYFMLKLGDLIFTGTPAGVGPVSAGDKLNGFLEGEKNFSVNVR